jgi:hypothetical protein
MNERIRERSLIIQFFMSDGQSKAWSRADKICYIHQDSLNLNLSGQRLYVCHSKLTKSHGFRSTYYTPLPANLEKHELFVAKPTIQQTGLTL